MGPMRSALLLCLASPLLGQGDWPAHRHDQARSGRTTASLDAPRLAEAWRHEARTVPSPAWPGPARWDAYAGLAGLKSMRNYDPVFHPVAVGDAVWYPSSSEDAVVCLDAATGQERWRFVTGGPVRIAPTWSEGRLYFGSDDGAAYCIEASTGELVWRVHPTEGKRLLLNNGRLISRWPVRSGVAVDGETAYFTASLLPWRSSYVCAVDAATGEQRYVNDLGTGWTLEGALALSASLLVAPQGRVAPLRFDRATGRSLGSFEGGGGSFCLITEDDRVLHGPGNKTGWITDSGSGGERLASFERGNAVVLGEGAVFVLTDETLGCIDRASGLVRWSVPHRAPFTMVMAGEHLLLGGDERVEARRASDGRLVWAAEVEGRAHGMAVSQDRLLVSTDLGHLVAFEATGEAYVVADDEEPLVPVLGEAAPIPRASGRGLVDRWVFQANALAEDAPVFASQVRGRPGAQALGTLDLRQVGELQAIGLDGRSRDVAITSKLEEAALPAEELSVCAWVRIDAPTEWGGILGASQDNGAYERGWLLGYRKDRFGFALKATEGPDRLTWLVAPQALVLRGWHHVAATYDGEAMRLYVDGALVAESEEQGGPIHYPEWAYYHAGAYRDQDEYFRATGLLHELRVYDRALASREVAAQHGELAERFPAPEVLVEAPEEEAEVVSLVLARGPELRFTGPGEAQVTWEAEVRGAGSSIDLVAPNGEVRSFRQERRGRARLTGLRPDTLYTYRVRSGERISASFECDTHFDFHPAGGAAAPAGEDEVAALSAALDAVAGRGQVLVLGADGSLARQVGAALPWARVTVVVEDAQVAGSMRQEGLRALAFAGDGPLALPGGWANAVLVSKDAADSEVLLERGGLDSLRPYGGVAYLPEALARFGASVQGVQPTPSDLAPYTRHRRGAPEGAGEWSHMYGTPAASAYGGEELGGVRRTDDLELTWLGRPGPRYQTDRQNRKPAPLSVNGRLFLQGLNRVIAMDACNGSILWGLELPQLQRFNIPRSSANWCADDEHLYLAMRDRAHAVHAATGSTVRVHELPDEGAEWGYLASVGDLLLGSVVREGGHHTRWWGSVSWYDAKSGDDAAKVVSDRLFAVSKRTGRERWSYSGGRILDATIVQHGGSIWFVEARDEATRAIPRGRVHESCLWEDLHLVCLDLERGTVRWERSAKPMAGTAAFYMLYGEGRLVLSSSQQGASGTPGGGSFALYTFDAATGESLWRKKLAWETDHHGKHLSRPAIVEGEVIVRPAVLDLASGDPIDRPFPAGHQCGTYVATKSALFLRAGELCVWDREEGGGTRWTRVRPDCWISTIPACGMLLSPEGGGGCSCGSWLEASMGFSPTR